MTTTSIYELSREDLEKRLSLAMEATVGKLVDDGLLSSENADAFLTTHTMIEVCQQSITSRLRDFLFGSEEKAKDKARICVVKLHARKAE